MTTERHHIDIGGIQVEVVRKKIKNLHVGVYPPHGRVRVSAPQHVAEDTLRTAIISRLGWIRRKQREFLDQARQSQREFVTGESHYFFGRRYRLDVVEATRASGVRVRNSGTIELSVPLDAPRSKREAILNEWYRRQLKKEIPPLVSKWEPRVGVQVAEWGVRRMKTLWGSCNPKSRRIWINLELAKKPLGCLEYIVVHEMVHFHERRHNDRFRSLMDQVMPQWRNYRDQLNAAPLAHETWDY